MESEKLFNSRVNSEGNVRGVPKKLWKHFELLICRRLTLICLKPLEIAFMSLPEGRGAKRFPDTCCFMKQIKKKMIMRLTVINIADEA